MNEVSNLLTYVVVKIPATPSNVCDAFFLGGGSGFLCWRNSLSAMVLLDKALFSLSAVNSNHAYSKSGRFGHSSQCTYLGAQAVTSFFLGGGGGL